VEDEHVDEAGSDGLLILHDQNTDQSLIHAI
jgi:hypothetical protein